MIVKFFFVPVTIAAVLGFLSPGLWAGSLNRGNLKDHPRVKRGFSSYYYNFLDEIAMSTCAALANSGPMRIFPVRRTCGEISTCQQICKDDQLRLQASVEVQSMTWSCIESLYINKNPPALEDNFYNDTDVHKLGLSMHRFHSCTTPGCGPNYCCCTAFNTTDTGA